MLWFLKKLLAFWRLSSYIISKMFFFLHATGIFLGIQHCIFWMITTYAYMYLYLALRFTYILQFIRSFSRSYTSYIAHFHFSTLKNPQSGHFLFFLEGSDSKAFSLSPKWKLKHVFRYTYMNLIKPATALAHRSKYM